MLPEGLQHASVENIVSRIASLGMNVVRHGYAIGRSLFAPHVCPQEDTLKVYLRLNFLCCDAEMVDDVFDRNGSDVSLQEACVQGLSVENGTKVMEQILEKNADAGWSSNTTRFEVGRRPYVLSPPRDSNDFAGLRLCSPFLPPNQGPGACCSRGGRPWHLDASRQPRIQSQMVLFAYW